MTLYYDEKGFSVSSARVTQRNFEARKALIEAIPSESKVWCFAFNEWDRDQYER
ncbi:MAG: hypothetical protein MMC33_005471 [Icmadophila ericetorum]|nr:hypothetical protein [Icmadophila ericetorum]